MGQGHWQAPPPLHMLARDHQESENPNSDLAFQVVMKSMSVRAGACNLSY